MEFDALYEEIVGVSGSRYHARIKRRMRYTWEKVSPLISSDSTVAEIGVGPRFSQNFLIRATQSPSEKFAHR
ncbi:unnamed protein product, partial [marine sediment metagenome]